MGLQTKYLKISILLTVLFATLVAIFFLSINKDPHNNPVYRNGLRLKTIRTLQTSLEVYFNEKTAFPEKLGEMSSAYLDPSLLDSWPRQEIKNSACPQNNTFTYRADKQNKSYNIDFCLPENDPDHTSGNYSATPQGIFKR